MHRQIHRLYLIAIAIVMVCQPGCKSITGPLPPAEEVVLPVSDEALILTTMNFEEAKRLTAKQLEMPPYFKVAAEKIDVVKASADGTPLRVRAKGKVYLEVAYLEPARILCHEAYLSEDEVIVRGRPILQRGGSMIEGTDEYTVFYLYGRKVRVIGNHRVITNAQLGSANSGNAPELGSTSMSGGVAIPYRPSPLPRGPWSMGPNPLLPPLSPTDVPASVRRELRGSDLPPADDDPLNPGPLMAPMPEPSTPTVEMKEPKAEAKPPAPAPKPAEAKKKPEPKK
ncbi:MAG: hypothetical protein H7A55_03495 [Verrucomicrobiaceae bacterium]|nr:hypothetical protein [Verrucomicrobiaceae bacterium]